MLIIFFEAVCSGSFRRCVGELLSRFGGVLRECFFQPLRFFGAAPLRQTLANAVHGRGQPVLVDRLHQIVDGLRVERAQGMLAISGDEHE